MELTPQPQQSQQWQQGSSDLENEIPGRGGIDEETLERMSSAERTGVGGLGTAPQIGTAFSMHATGMSVFCNLQTLKSCPSAGKLRLCFMLLDADSLTKVTSSWVKRKA